MAERRKPPRPLPTIVQELLRWREKNGLSRADAVQAMAERGFPARIRTLQHWEQGDRHPNPYAQRELERFLEANPSVPAPTRRRPGPKKR
jgi:DNA-binding transcriptional regulator YiaG